MDGKDILCAVVVGEEGGKLSVCVGVLPSTANTIPTQTRHTRRGQTRDMGV